MNKHLILMLLTVCCNVSANLFLKAGSSVGGRSLWELINLKTFLGLCLFGIGAIFYIAALRIGSLSVSQAIVSLQYVGVLLGAYLVFHEQLSLVQLAGCGLVLIGIMLVTY
ncbi:MAG: EamA family transporter, partial [Desulfovibrio sp.]|nr:EamA family transporter [Desulfovibrio sp.]